MPKPKITTIAGISALLVIICPLSAQLTQPSASEQITSLNHHNAASASRSEGHFAVSSPAASVSPQQYETYNYAEPGKEYCLVIPKRLKTARGILVVCNYAGGDSRDYYTQNWYSEFMDLHGFAFVGSKGNNSHAASYQAFLRAVKQFSIESHHPELVNAPYATTGFSAGGGFASTLLTSDPGKVIASAPVGARINFDVFKAPDAPTAAHLGVPTCLITGENEKLNDPAV